jgi:hypothetical protein
VGRNDSRGFDSHLSQPILKRMNQEVIYLASPYSHPDDSVRIENYRKISKVAAKMTAEGKVVFSPISYGHNLVDFHEMPTSWDFWITFCFNFLIKCDRMIVCKMEGWDKSKGVLEEISIAKDHGIPVEYIKYEE